MKVLLGIGGGDDGFRAFDHCIAQATEGQYDLTIGVIDNPETDADPTSLTTEVEARLEETGITAPVRRITGDPGSELVRIAETEGFDAIAIGGGSYSPLGKITLGHIAEFVVLNAHVTVILGR